MRAGPSSAHPMPLSPTTETPAAGGSTANGGSGGAATGGGAGTSGAPGTGGSGGNTGKGGEAGTAAGGAAGTGEGGAAGASGAPGQGGSAGGSNPEAGKVNCGTATCDLATEVCCVGWPTSYACKDKCSGLEATTKCDGPEDCTNQVCCAGFPSGSSCKAACGAQEQEICHTNTDCASPKTCMTCSTPGGGPDVAMCTEKCPY